MNRARAECLNHCQVLRPPVSFVLGKTVTGIQPVKLTHYKQNPLLKPAKALYKLGERMLGALNLADNLLVVLRKCV